MVNAKILLMKQLLLVSMCLWGGLSFGQEKSQTNSVNKQEKVVSKEKTSKSSTESVKEEKIYLPLDKKKLRTVRVSRIQTTKTKL